ncbi:F-actin-monooxygenase mical1-like isoform X2 [Clytia hemisphaerica]|uniref:F-actin monooxygenase n=1 Tax=Clytia hemisphaerica TaxID=252671 RepID=A0A7M5VB56_9CNID
MDVEEGEVNNIDATYNKLLAANDIPDTVKYFAQLCELLDINPKNHKTVLTTLKAKLKSWKYQNLFNKLEKRGKHQDYKNKPCAKTKVLIIGAGPVGLRLAIECAFLGAHVTIIEKRNKFSRNNVLHLWPFLIVDLKGIGVKSFFGKFCSGSLDHISIKRMQCILLKIALFLGVQFHVNVLFEDVIQPSEGKGWRAKISPSSSPISGQEFDAICGCDGKYNCLKFKRKEFRGKLAIAITCNFVNKQTSEEARVEEISGVAFIYNQDFFHELKQKTGIELENIVYYRDETHYFVMTAKKKSLLATGVIKQDCKDVFKLLSSDNVNHKNLLKFAKDAADFSTNYQLPHHQFAVNHYQKEDVAMFDFTSIHQAENSSRIYERKGKRLLMCIAGDVLLEPFWPTGSGCARGFLGAFDAAWMIRGLGLNRESLDILQERESIFQLLPQTKPDNLCRKHDLYCIDPSTRYLNLNARSLRKEQISHLLDATDSKVNLADWAEKLTDHQKQLQERQREKKRKEKEIDPDHLLRWCKEQTKSYQNVTIVDMSRSWQNGLGFCAIIHRYRPELIDYHSLKEEDARVNCEKAFEVAEEHLGIPPKIAARDFVRSRNPDTLTVMAYLSLYYEALHQETPVASSAPKEKTPAKGGDTLKVEAQTIPVSPKSPVEKKGKTSKMAIISRLSRRSKKSKLAKKAKHDRENQQTINEENDVQLQSYTKKQEINGNALEHEKNAINASKKDEVQKKTSPMLRSRDNKLTNGNAGNEPLENMEASKGQQRYKRISQLAESVFGDSIVQEGTKKGSGLRPRKESSVEGLSESELCHFCNRKVYVVERQSAEGLFFHRSCFRCTACKCRLLLGNYAFHCKDEETEGKFYCNVHYNSLLYKGGKEEEEERNLRPTQVVVKKESVKRRRAVTQQIMPSDVRAANYSRQLSNDDLDITTKSQQTSQVLNIQKKLKNNLPQLEVSTKDTKHKPYFTKADVDKIDSSQTPEEKEDQIESPYDRFTPRSLLDRHPSLLRCTPEKVTTKSFMAASKFSVSTPNLTKLIQEDSMFEEEKKKHEAKLNSQKKKKLEYSPTKEKKKLSVPDQLRDSNKPTNEDDQEIYGSDEYRQRYQSYVSREDSFGAVHRRPQEERRAQYPVSMAFTEGMRIPGSTFRPISVDIDIDGAPDLVEPPTSTQTEPEKAKPKKKKLVLRKKKKTLKPETIVEDESELIPSPIRKISQGKDTSPQIPMSSKTTEDGSSKVSPVSPINPFTSPRQQEDRGRGMFSDSSSSSESEEDERNNTLFKRAFGGGKKKKKALTEEERRQQEQKAKRREQRKIRKEMKERESKRLWEAQSIQWKLNEVDVKMYELEERAKSVERSLRDGNTPPADTNKLTFEWFNLVNEKNTLLRFESELVIQSNSIQLEDRQARLEQRIRDLLTSDSPRKKQHEEVERLTKELVDTVEQRNGLVEMLEGDRLRELEEDKTIEDVFTQKAHAFGMDRLI